MDFSGRTAIVTGSGSGIGKATSIMLAKRGAHVIITDINSETLESTKAEIEAFGGKVMAFVCDVTDEARVNEVADETRKLCGKIDILVNNAGIFRTWYPFASSDSAEWKKKIDINILGVMYFTRAVLSGMIENGWGRVINIGSIAGKYGLANMVDYSMTKGAVRAFSVALAKEVTELGVTVNCVSPGNVSANGSQNTELSFINRSGRPEEYASVICFLASEEASYVSGQDYLVDGCRKRM